MLNQETTSRDSFSWRRFTDFVLQRFAHDSGYAGDVQRMEQNHPIPDDDFVRKAKKSIALYWLGSRAAIAERIVKELHHVHNQGPWKRDAHGYVHYLAKCRPSKAICRLLCKELIRFGTDGEPEHFGVTSIGPWRKLVPSEQPKTRLEPYPYQELVWHELNIHLAEARSTGVFTWLLVMPTGSGKTFTAVQWLTEHHLNEGGKVLWIAHRYDLLEQAAFAFYRAARLANKLSCITVRIVSGRHDPVANASWKTDNVVICSIHSLARNPAAAKRLVAGKNVFLVIDEAHHAPAESYSRLLKIQEKQPERRLLGLTATPTRTKEDEKPLLAQKFGGHKIEKVSVRDLINQKYLAVPYPEVVDTEIDAEQGITDEDRRQMARFNELTPDWQTRLAKLDDRNSKIVCRYMDRDYYGKTLVFAINILHADLLCKQFRKKGVRVDYVASERLDGRAVENGEIIEQFRKGELDVLINVQILTEGIDIPSIQTVFLTRPTRSEILVRQMIGRALRGPRVPGGTERAYLVSFADHWSEFPAWESSFDLVSDVVAEAPESAPVKPPVPKPLLNLIPLELIQAAAEELHRLGRYQLVHAFEAVPHGLYVLERETDTEDQNEFDSQTIPVYEHQHACWQELIHRLWPVPGKKGAVPERTKERSRQQADLLDDLYDRFFHDCDIPKPGQHYLQTLIEHQRRGGKCPTFVPFEARTQVDPQSIADEIRRAELGETARAELIKARFGLPLAQAIYHSLPDFDRAIQQALLDLRYPEEATRLPRVQVVFEPPPGEPMRPGPAHDLEVYLREVLKRGAQLLGAKKLSFCGSLSWTRNWLRSHFGQARKATQGTMPAGEILINRLLDTPDVKPETVKFLLWHEYLHLYILEDGHPKKFRDLEHLWPKYEDADRELDTLHQRFGLIYK